MRPKLEFLVCACRDQPQPYIVPYLLAVAGLTRNAPDSPKFRVLHTFLPVATLIGPVRQGALAVRLLGPGGGTMPENVGWSGSGNSRKVSLACENMFLVAGQFHSASRPPSQRRSCTCPLWFSAALYRRQIVSRQ
jgi:hypothetical protein